MALAPDDHPRTRGTMGRAAPAGPTLVTGMVSPDAPFVNLDTGTLMPVPFRFLNSLLQPTSANVQEIVVLRDRVTVVETYGPRVSALEGEMATANAQIANINAQIGAINSQIGAINGQLASLDGRVSALEGQVASILTRMANFGIP